MSKRSMLELSSDLNTLVNMCAMSVDDGTVAMPIVTLKWLAEAIHEKAEEDYAERLALASECQKQPFTPDADYCANCSLRKEADDERVVMETAERILRNARGRDSVVTYDEAVNLVKFCEAHRRIYATMPVCP